MKKLIFILFFIFLQCGRVEKITKNNKNTAIKKNVNIKNSIVSKEKADNNLKKYKKLFRYHNLKNFSIKKKNISVLNSVKKSDIEKLFPYHYAEILLKSEEAQQYYYSEIYFNKKHFYSFIFLIYYEYTWKLLLVNYQNNKIIDFKILAELGGDGASSVNDFSKFVNDSIIIKTLTSQQTMDNEIHYDTIFKKFLLKKNGYIEELFIK